MTENDLETESTEVTVILTERHESYIYSSKIIEAILFSYMNRSNVMLNLYDSKTVR